MNYDNHIFFFRRISCHLLFCNNSIVPPTPFRHSRYIPQPKIDPSFESVQSLHFSTWPKLEAIFSQIKGSSYEISLLCDRKYKHEIEENRKVLVTIIDTTVTLGRIGVIC